MNLSDREMELNFREITCKRSVQGQSFAQGIQEYSFSVSGKNAWIPSMSYFVIQAQLTMNARTAPVNTGVAPTPGGVPISPAVPRVPYLSDQIALTDHFGSNLYNNAFFRAGNSDVSTIMQYLGQASVLKTRMDKSHSWQKNVGAKLSQDDGDFVRRSNRISLDGRYHEDGLVAQNNFNQRALLQTSGAPIALNTVLSASATYVAATSVLTFAGTNPVNALVSAIAKDDEITIGAGLAYKVRSVLTATTILVVPINVANVDQAVALQVVDDVAPADPKCGFNNVQVVFRPPIGLFNVSQPLSGGDFRIDLNPSPNFATSGVQSKYNLVAGVDYNLVIQNVLFYVCQIKADVSPTGIIPLSLMEMQVINKSLAGTANGSSVNLDFTVPPSTLFLTVFIQSSRAGTNTSQPATQFYSGQNTLNNVNDANLSNNVQFIQVTYGSVTKTQTLYSSKYQPLSTGLINDQGINYNIQRWYQSYQYAGMAGDTGGFESHDTYIDRGAHYSFDFSRDKNDSSSYVNVQIAFNSEQAIDPSDQLFLVASYSRQAEMQYENGYITQVVSVNR